MASASFPFDGTSGNRFPGEGAGAGSSSTYARLEARLAAEPHRWLVTGCAGFIGSHLVAKLLSLGQHVSGLDDFSSGTPDRLGDVLAALPASLRQRFRFHEGDIRNAAKCREACRGADYVLHQAAFVSVPRSITEPDRCQDINLGGFRQVLDASLSSKVRRVVYASSSAVYGDVAEPPTREEAALRPAHPYGASKLACEHWARAYREAHGTEATALRYFNVFGEGQNPHGGFAAVIPRWVAAFRSGSPCLIHGDGTQTRDFCPVADIVQANLLAATAPADGASAYNVGLGARTSLLELHALLAELWRARHPRAVIPAPVHLGVRAGDIAHSHADITKIREDLGYVPAASLRDALAALLLEEGVPDPLPEGLPT